MSAEKTWGMDKVDSLPPGRQNAGNATRSREYVFSVSPLSIPEPASYGLTRSTDTPLYWCRYGSDARGRPPLLVLHGGPGAHHDYLLPQMLALADTGAGRELLFYDQRGGGRSKTTDRAPITWRTNVDDLASVIE